MKTVFVPEIIDDEYRELLKAMEKVGMIKTYFDPYLEKDTLICFNKIPKFIQETFIDAVPNNKGN